VHVWTVSSLQPSFLPYGNGMGARRFLHTWNVRCHRSIRPRCIPQKRMMPGVGLLRHHMSRYITIILQLAIHHLISNPIDHMSGGRWVYRCTDSLLLIHRYVNTCMAPTSISIEFALICTFSRMPACTACRHACMPLQVVDSSANARAHAE